MIKHIIVVKKKALLTHLSGPEDKGKLAFVSYVLIILLTSTKRMTCRGNSLGPLRTVLQWAHFQLRILINFHDVSHCHYFRVNWWRAV